MKNPALRHIFDRMLGGVISVILILAGLAIYNSYKYYFWPHVQAVVTSIEPICIYAKHSGRRRSTVKYLSCDADSEAQAAGLIADGYKLGRDKKALVRALYEAEPGRQTPTILRPWWESVATLRPGSVIQIRYSPGSPNEAELVTGAQKVAVVVLGFFLGALLLACVIGVLTYEGDEPAASG